MLFGRMPDGTGVERFTLRNDRGLEVAVITYGAILTAIKTPDRTGRVADVALGFDDLESYRVVLTRIIMERQPEKMRLFPIDMLHFILRSNDVMSDFLRDYFRHALPYLEYLQRHSAAAAKTFVQPIHWVKAWLDSIAPHKANEVKQNSLDESGHLAQRVEELEARLRQLEEVNRPVEELE